jgi:AcrR family transcriptional regulator
MAGRRKYDSSARRADADRTRRRIVECAATLFERDGYAGTSIRRIAEAADVSPETVYAAFGTKATLLARAVDLRVEGDGEPRPLIEQPWVRDLARETTVEGRLALLVEHGMVVVERAAPLLRAVRAAALSDATVAELLRSLEQAREQDTYHLFDLLVTDLPLRAGIDRDEAAAWFATLSSDLVLLDVVERRGLTPERHRHWIRETVRRTLFPD